MKKSNGFRELQCDSWTMKQICLVDYQTDGTELMLAEDCEEKLDSHLYAFNIQDFCSRIYLVVIVNSSI